MGTFNWDSFLRQWSLELLESMGESQSIFPREVVESQWLGYPGAREEQITHAEARLGVELPPSYREFLKVTNGWRHTTPFIHRLWSTEELAWFHHRHQDWINAYVEQHLGQQLMPSVNGSENISYSTLEVRVRSISDEDYLVYGDRQHCNNLRVEYLQTALEISDRGDSAIYLLNPQVVTADGEWEAWFFCDWLPGADRYRSFHEMMQAEYINFLEIKDAN